MGDPLDVAAHVADDEARTMIDGYSDWIVTVVAPDGATTTHMALALTGAAAVRIVLRRAAFQDGRIVVKALSVVEVPS